MAEVRTTSSTGGQKGTKLARFDLIPTGPLTELAEHYGRGAAKYANHQWRKGYEWSKSYAALQRHLMAFWAGLDRDVCSNEPDNCVPWSDGAEHEPDTCFNHTGSHHMAAVAWHAFLLLEFKDEHPDHDDRYRPALCGETIGPVPKLDGEVFTCALPPHGDDVDHEGGGAWWVARREERQEAERKQSGLSRADRHAYATTDLEPDEDVIVYGIRDGFDIPEPEVEQHQAAGRWSVGERAEDLVDAEQPIRELAKSWVEDYDAEANGYSFRTLRDFPRVETGLITLAEATEKFGFFAGMDLSGFQDSITEEVRRITRAADKAVEDRLLKDLGPDLLSKRAPRVGVDYDDGHTWGRG